MRIRTLTIVMMGVLTTASMSTPALAGLSDCQDVYVGRIWVERGFGLRAVVFLASPTAASGSYWTYFDNWSADEKKSALAMLEGAKLAGHRIHVATDNADGCGIVQDSTFVKSITLSTNP